MLNEIPSNLLGFLNQIRIVGSLVSFDNLQRFVETIFDFEGNELLDICALHIIWYLLRSPSHKNKTKTSYWAERSDMIYENIKNMFTIKQQPIPADLSWAFDRTLQLLRFNRIISTTEDLKQKDELTKDSCWLVFTEYDNPGIPKLINDCHDSIEQACKGASIYSLNDFKGKKNDVDEFFDKQHEKDPNVVNKLKITIMLEHTEETLRDLLVARYEKYADWTRKKEYVPSNIISKMYTKDFAGFRGLIAKKADDASHFVGKIRILSHVQAFVNACTLGELVEIIVYRKGNFTEKKNKETKKLEGGPYKEKELQRAIDNFEELEKIRNRRSHLDDQLTWGVEMVEKMKVLRDAIIGPIVNYLSR